MDKTKKLNDTSTGSGFKNSSRDELERELARVESIEATYYNKMPTNDETIAISDTGKVNKLEESPEEISVKAKSDKPLVKNNISETKQNITPKQKQIPARKPITIGKLERPRHEIGTNKIKPERRSKTRTLGTFLAFILFFSLIGLSGWLYYQQLLLKDQLETTQDQLNNQEYRLSEVRLAGERRNALAGANGYMEIPEWKVKYRSDINTAGSDKDIKYKFMINSTSGVEYLGFYSAELARTATNRKLINNSPSMKAEVYGCGKDAYFATIYRVKANDIEVDGKVSEAKLREFYRFAANPNSSIYKKIGDYYYLATDTYVTDGNFKSCLPDGSEYKKEQDKAKDIASYAKKIVQNLEQSQ